MRCDWDLQDLRRCFGRQPSLAGPCTAEIDRAQAQLDQRVDAIAGAGATGTQSTAAQVHRQPTPGSIASAEQKLGEGTALEPALSALALARKPMRPGIAPGAKARWPRCRASSVPRNAEPFYWGQGRAATILRLVPGAFAPQNTALVFGTEWLRWRAALTK